MRSTLVVLVLTAGGLLAPACAAQHDSPTSPTSPTLAPVEPETTENAGASNAAPAPNATENASPTPTPAETSPTVPATSPATATTSPRNVDIPWIEHNGRKYRPTSLDELREDPEEPGRVVIDARLWRVLSSDRLLFQETPGEPSSEFVVYGAGLPRNSVYRLYLRLERGYKVLLRTSDLPESGARAIVLEDSTMIQK